MKTLQQAYRNQQHTPSGCSARWFKGGTTRRWDRGLMPSTGYCSALTLDQPPGLSSLLLHALFLPRWPALCDGVARMSWSCCLSRGGVMVNVRTVHGSRYMLIRFKDWLEVFFKASVLFLYLEKKHMMKVLITFALTAQRIIPLFVKCRSSVWCDTDKVEDAALFQYF